VRPAVVAVSQRVDTHPDRGERRDALDGRMIAWIVATGALPVPVPNALAEVGSLAGWLDAVRPDALLLSGGNDIGAEPARDATERTLLAWAVAGRRPVLGICRGLQMIATEAGGTLVRRSGHAGTRHGIVPETGAARTVNSYHDFGLGDLPPGYRATATAEDGTIEAVRHADLPWEGWMWHPEREDAFERRDLDRAAALWRAIPCGR
jgi:gamma-glutamyl-gamma-aminobutyrate hydrolase PuuD